MKNRELRVYFCYFPETITKSEELRVYFSYYSETIAKSEFSTLVFGNFWELRVYFRQFSGAFGYSDFILTFSLVLRNNPEVRIDDGGWRRLAVFWRCSGGVLAVFWQCSGSVLAVLWQCLHTSYSSSLRSERLRRSPCLQISVEI